MRGVLDGLRTVCLIVGAVVLYCALMALLWAAVIGMIRRAGRGRLRRRAHPPAAPGGAAGGGDGQRRARAWEELPSWLYRDRPWAVAAVLLGAPLIRERTAEFVDFANRKIDWYGLLAASAGWPADQRLLVMTAHELAFDTVTEVERALSEPVTLHDMVRAVDDDAVRRIQVAMDVRRGRMKVDEALTQLTG
jgi:hypothetical protein